MLPTKSRRSQSVATNDTNECGNNPKTEQKEDLAKKVDFLLSRIKELEDKLFTERKKTEDLEKKIKQQEEKNGKKKSSQPRYWRKDEHERFLEALDKYGRKDVKSIAMHVRTRNPTQVRTHAQKWFLKQKREEEKKKQQEEESRAKKLEEQRHNAIKYFSSQGFWPHPGMSYPASPYGYQFQQSSKMNYHNIAAQKSRLPQEYGVRPAFIPYTTPNWDQRFSAEEVRLLLNAYQMFQDKPDVIGSIQQAGMFQGRTREEIGSMLASLTGYGDQSPVSNPRPLKRRRTGSESPSSFPYPTAHAEPGHYRPVPTNSSQPPRDEKKPDIATAKYHPTLTQEQLQALSNIENGTIVPPPSGFGTPTSPPPALGIVGAEDSHYNKPRTPINSSALRNLSDTMQLKHSPPSRDNDHDLSSCDPDPADSDITKITNFQMSSGLQGKPSFVFLKIPINRFLIIRV